ncbi:MAG: hypothetical protein AAGE89_04770 [Pseudomonadota bacterium]
MILEPFDNPVFAIITGIVHGLVLLLSYAYHCSSERSGPLIAPVLGILGLLSLPVTTAVFWFLFIGGAPLFLFLSMLSLFVLPAATMMSCFLTG